jgi:hypothetical protein
MSQPRSYEFYLGAARVALTLGLSKVRSSSENSGQGNATGASRVRGFFLYSFRRLLTPYLLLQVQRSKRWSGKGREGGSELDVVGVLEVEMPASMNRLEPLLTMEEWKQMGAETEGCYLAYQALHVRDKVVCLLQSTRACKYVLVRGAVYVGFVSYDSFVNSVTVCTERLCRSI